MEKTPLFIFGSSGHAKVIIDIAEQTGQFSVIGLLDSFKPPGEQVLGYPVLGNEEILPRLFVEYPQLQLFIGIGDNFFRELVRNKIVASVPTACFATLIHPAAVIGKSVTIGHGSVVMPGAVINADSRVGAFAIINTLCCVEHEGQLEDYCSLASGVILGGNCRIGHSTAIGYGVTLTNGIEIGSNTVIAGGAVVTHDIGSDVIATGVPAEVIRSRKPGEKYL